MKFTGALAALSLLSVAQAANPRAIASTSVANTATTAKVSVLFSENVIPSFGSISISGTNPLGAVVTFPLTPVSQRQFELNLNLNQGFGFARGTWEFTLFANNCIVRSQANTNDCMVANSNTVKVNLLPAGSLLSTTSILSDPAQNDCRVGGTGCTTPFVPPAAGANPVIYNFNQGPGNVIVGVALNDGNTIPSANPASKVTATVQPFIGGAIAATTVSNFVFLQGSVVFHAQGKNNNRLVLRVGAGLVTDKAGNESPATNDIVVNFQYVQACTYGPDTVTAYSSCSCATGSTTGTATRTRSPGVKIGPLNGGADCAARSSTTESKACTCAASNTCAGRCGEALTYPTVVTATTPCSCGAGCAGTPQGCCADVGTTCPANLPNCYDPDTYAAGQAVSAAARVNAFQACGTTLLDKSTASAICTCDDKFGPGTLAATTPGYVRPCANFDGASGGGCAKAFCSILTKTAAPAAGQSAAWCTGGAAALPTGGVFSNGACSCDPACVAAGNCCSDYATFCPSTPITSYKCNGKCNQVLGDIAGFRATGDFTKICMCVAPGLIAGYPVSVCSDNACV